MCTPYDLARAVARSRRRQPTLNGHAAAVCHVEAGRNLVVVHECLFEVEFGMAARALYTGDAGGDWEKGKY